MAGLLRIATAGSVDDGKSTLIGRLLHDAKAVFADQLDAVTRVSHQRGNDEVDLALLTDGLRAEREQGITIDVAYRYFATPRRTFILADTPGHVQYTRNMVTGASTADVALVLVDARKGVLEQTRRHTAVAALLRVPHVVLVVNKMDLVGFDEATYDAIVRDFRDVAGRLGVEDVAAVPLAALHGDNVVEASSNAPWYDGPPLLTLLESLDVDRAERVAARFPVQYVIRPQTAEHRDYRGYAGQIAGGILRAGDPVAVLPSGLTTTVAAIDTYDGSRAEAYAGQSVVVRLNDDVDVSRGDVIVALDGQPAVAREHTATLCWLSEQPLSPGARVLVKHTTRVSKAVIDQVVDRLDLTTLAHQPGVDRLSLNEIGTVRLRTQQPLAVDPYADNRATGGFIVIDEASGATVAAGMVTR